MKKLVSLILTVAMVMSLVATVTPISADTTSDNLIFSMDLSESTESEVVVTDAAADSVDEGITVNDGLSVNTIEETGTKYLVLDSREDLGVFVTDSEVQEAGDANITVEMWAKADSDTINGYGEWLFTLHNGSEHAVKLERSAEKTLRFGTKNNTVYYSENRYSHTDWTHWVLTRTYDADAKTATVTAYMNGVAIGSKSSAEDTEFVATDTTNATMYIGSFDSYNENFKNAFVGGIGACNVYNTVLSADEVKASYDASVGNYYELDDTGLIFSMDLSESTESEVVVKDSTADLVDETITVRDATSVATVAETGKQYLMLTDASKSGLAVTDSAVQAAGNSNITVETWAKADSDTQSGSGDFLFSLRNTDGKYAAKMERNATKTMGFATQDQDTDLKFSESKYSHTDWTHWVLTRSYDAETQSATLTAYRNGELLNSASSTEFEPTDSTGSTMYIGTPYQFLNAFTNAFVGGIGACNVYNKVLTADEVQTKYDESVEDYYVLDDSGLVFSMDLSESTESQVVVKDKTADLVGETITIPSAGFAVDTVEGKETKYLKVSDADQAGIKIVDTAVNALGRKDITLEMWTKADSNSATGVANYTEYVFTLHNGSKHNLQFTRSGENVNLDSQYTSSQARVTVEKPEQTEWTHWVITRTYDDTAASGTLTAYKNGVQCGTAPITKEMVDTATSGAMYIGGAAAYNATWSNPFVGGIGACNVYNRALSADEVKANYDDSAEDYYTIDNTGLIFSMDLSDSTESQVKVKDKTDDLVDETITVRDATSVGTVAGTGTKYLMLTDASKSGLAVTDSAVQAAGNSNITVEMWAKADSDTQSGSGDFLFSLHDGSTYAARMERNAAKTLLFAANHNDLKYSETKYSHTDWTHWTFTRSYDANTKSATLTAYRNGEELETITTASGAEATLYDSSKGTMYIGTPFAFKNAFTNAFVGGIGACNVYNKVLTADEIKANYDASVEDYYVLEKTDLIFSMDLSESTESQVVVKDKTADLVGETITIPSAGFAVDTVEGKETKYLKVSDADQAGVKVVDEAVNALGRKDITLEMWTKADSNTATPEMEWAFTLHNGSRHNLDYTRSGADVYLENQYATTYERIVVAKPEQTEWTHWVLTRTYDETSNEGTLTAYRNGVQCGTAALDEELPDTSTSGAMYIGGAHTYLNAYTQPFVGGIGACNVYSKALTADEVNDKYLASVEDYRTLDKTGLVFSMDLSDSTESQVVVKDKTADLVGETITIPSAGFAVDTVEGKQTKYLKVSDDDQAGVKVVDEAVNALGRKDITLEMWTKADSNTATPEMEWAFTLHNGSRHNLDYTRSGADVYLENQYATTYERIVVAKPEQTEWTHWVLTRTYDETSNEGTLTAYRNGVQCGTAALDEELPDTSTNGAMYIGGAHTYLNAYTQPFVGGISVCNVYNKALTAAEVKAKYDESAEDYQTLDKTGLVFDMDLSNYDTASPAAAKGIVDATADLTDETLTLHSGAVVEPISEGSAIKALKLNGSTQGGIKALDSDIDAAASSDTMTVETWMKVNNNETENNGVGHAFLYTTASDAHNWQAIPIVKTDDETGITNRSITNTVHKTNTVSHEDLTYGEWAHYVFTREYDTTAQTCTLTLSVNGIQKDKQVLTGISGPQTMSDGIMHIGGGTFRNGAAYGIDGEMATFKVYNRVLSEGETFANYLDSASDFGHILPEGFLLTNIKWNPTEIDAATEDISVDFKVINTNESKELFCALAVYDADGYLVACDSDTTITVGGDVPLAPVSLSVTGLTPVPGYYARVFVWSRKLLKPLTDGSDRIYYPEEETNSVWKTGYLAGPKTLELSEEDCVQLENASYSGNTLNLQSEGEAEYGFYLPFDAESITLTFADSNSSVNISDGTDTYVIESGEAANEVTYKFDSPQRIGEKNFVLTGADDVAIEKVVFNKQPITLTGWYEEFVLPDLLDEEHAIAGAVLINENASAIMAKGSTRYINADDPTEIPKKVNDTIYLPAHTLARAFGAYHEEMADNSYVLLREPLSKAEIMIDPVQSHIEKDGVRTQIDNCAIFENGKAYLPVRLVAEAFDLSVDYYDGLLAIDDNKYYVEDELKDPEIRGYIDSVLEAFVPAETTGTTYHVAQTAAASDDNPGTAEQPFKTISKAGEVAVAGDTVIVHEGTYRETVTVKNNGQPTKPIVFKAAEGEGEVVISALDVIDGFEYQDGIYVAPYSWDLGKGRNQVFYNGESILEARYPNGPGLNLGDMKEPLSSNWPVVGDLVTDPDENLTVTSETLLNQDEVDYWKGAMFVTARGRNYELNTAVVESSKKGELTLDAESTSVYHWDKGIVGTNNWGFLVGHRNALDAPGEWIVEDGSLFVIPPEDADTDNLVLEGKRRQLVADLADNEYVQLRGFTTIGGSIKMNNSEMCVVDDCTIKYNNHFILSKDQNSGFIDDANAKDSNGAPARGEVGLYVGGRNNVLTDNIFEEAAGAAIYGVGQYTYIENNYIDGCGYAGSCVAGLYFNAEAWKSKTTPRGGHLIVHNTAFNTGRSPIFITRPPLEKIWPMIPWEIAYNEFFDGGLASNDTGVTYTYHVDHGNSRIKSKMHNNLVYYTPSETNTGMAGIYHDGGTQNIDTFENVIFTTQDDVRIDNPVLVQPLAAAVAICNEWNNRYIQGVENGRDGLSPEDYPRGVKPFDAGSKLNRDAYMVNYNARNSELDMSLWDEGILSPNEMSENVLVNGDGSYNMKDSGQWIKFEDVDLTGKNEIEIFYGGDKYLLDANKGIINIVLDDLSSSNSFRCSNNTVGTTYPEFSRTSMKRSIPQIDGVHDIYLRLVNSADIDLFGIRVNTQERMTGHTNIVYGGNFYSFTVKDTSRTPAKQYQPYDNKNPFVNNMWNGTTLMYKGVTIENATNELIVNYCTESPCDGQTIQIRLGSLDSEPIAELVTENVGWGVWDNDTVVPLNTTVESGTYDLYVTFEDKGGKTCNLYYLEFVNPNEAAATE